MPVYPELKYLTLVQLNVLGINPQKPAGATACILSSVSFTQFHIKKKNLNQQEFNTYLTTIDIKTQ